MKKTIIVAVLVLLLFSPIRANAQTIPDKIQHYAEGEGFRTFLEMAGPIQLKTSVQFSDLVLGEGFPVYQFSDKLFSVSKFSELIGEPTSWKYLITEPDGTVVASMRIYDSLESGLGSGGGGDTDDFSRCVDKMRELIRNFGGKDDLTVVHYGYDNSFLYYSFGGDERVIYVDGISFDQNILKIRDYHELPTGEEALTAMREEYSYVRKLMEENGGQPVYGGSDIQLPLHHYTSPLMIFLSILAAAITLLAVGIAVSVMKRRKSRSA